MSNYNFIPFINGVNRYDLALNCFPCKNLDEACVKARSIKSALNADFISIVKQITQI